MGLFESSDRDDDGSEEPSSTDPEFEGSSQTDGVVTRRQVLATASALGITGLAGCGSEGEGETGTNTPSDGSSEPTMLSPTDAPTQSPPRTGTGTDTASRTPESTLTDSPVPTRSPSGTLTPHEGEFSCGTAFGRDTFEDRRKRDLYEAACQTGGTRKQVYQALALFEIGADFPTANANVMSVAAEGDNLFHDRTATDEYWLMPTLLRIYLAFNSQDGTRRQVLSSEAETHLRKLFWEFVEREGANVFSDIHMTPTAVIGSENHDMQIRTSLYLCANILGDHPDYRDRTPSWEMPLSTIRDRGVQFWRDRLEHEAKHGLWIEGSGVYRGVSLKNYYNLRDFAEDGEVQRKADMLLDLVWIDYAHLTVDGLRGGPKSRLYPNWDRGKIDRVNHLGNRYFGHDSIPYIGDGHQMTECMVSDYRPPDIASAILSDADDSKPFEYVTRFPGVGKHSERRIGESGGEPTDLAYDVSESKTVLNYSYVAPEFVMGSFAQNNAYQLTLLSKQNRWEGLVFGAGDRTWVYPHHYKWQKRVQYMEFVTMQQGPIMLARESDSISYNDRSKTGRPALTVAPSSDANTYSVGDLVAEGGWFFGKEGDGYYGITAAGGSLTRADEQNFVPDANDRVLVIHAGRRSEDGSFESFRERVLDNPLETNGGVTTYSDDQWGTLRFEPGSLAPEDVRRVEGESVDYSPDKFLRSPYVDSDWASGEITVTVGDRTVLYDFEEATRTES